ncbi:peptidylprolyl isomerase [Micropruina sp.]|uniref:peptidylprolyl isomerase n=1 Tax=Micropruina sp. TaxID=2737536 RepID=UPI0039E485EC
MPRLLALLIVALLGLTACSSGSAPAPRTPAAGTTTCSYPSTGSPARAVDPPPSSDVPAVGTATFTLAMTGGTVTITGDRSTTPCTLNSFESLAKQKFFDGTACSRLADSGMFMVQCGDPSGSGKGGPGYRFADELTGSEKYTAGTVAMANSGADTNGSQFFIVYRDSPLPANYTVFGRVDAASLTVIESMAADGQDGSWGDGTGRPLNPFAIKSVTVG